MVLSATQKKAIYNHVSFSLYFPWLPPFFFSFIYYRYNPVTLFYCAPLPSCPSVIWQTLFTLSKMPTTPCLRGKQYFVLQKPVQISFLFWWFPWPLFCNCHPSITLFSLSCLWPLWDWSLGSCLSLHPSLLTQWLA